MKHANRLRLLSHKLGSGSLKLLAQGLSAKVGYPVFRSKFQKPHRVHLRYGDLKNKIEQYEYFQAHDIPALTFTTSSTQAKLWAEGGHTVVARLLTRASEGKGIVIAETPEQVPLAPVYTQYRKKKREFRVHVFKDKVVHVLEKRRKQGALADARVRNTANGYVFCSDNVTEPEGLRALALQASKVTQSDFKGVDIGYNEKKNELFVIEVNSAPGIMGTNVQRYIDVITSA
jgi:glutathione synthase/RimK-type ligase-like ATP-grasp enzyme